MYKPITTRARGIPPVTKAIIIAGIEARIGPKRGIISNAAARNARSSAFGTWIINNPR
jgi:hypothetical protein